MKVLLAGGLAALALAGAGCGSSDGPVTKAAKATIGARTTRVALAERIAQGGSTTTLYGFGTADLKARSSDVKLQLPAGSGASSMEELVSGDSIYLRMPGDGLPADRWIELTPTQLASLNAGTAGLSSTGLDPSAIITAFTKGGGPTGWRKLREMKLEGTPTTLYRSTVDVSKEISKHHADLTSQGKAIAGSALRSATIRYDVWVGRDDGRIHQVGLVVEGNRKVGSTVAIFTFSHFGAPVSIATPSRAKTVSFSSLAGATKS